jgi:general secretion pathway protein E
MEQRYVGEILVRRGALPPEKLEEVLTLAHERGSRLTDVIIAGRVVDESLIVRALADEVGLPFVDKLRVESVPQELIELVPISFARQNRVLPIGEVDGVVQVAVADPLDSFALDDLRTLLNRPVVAIAAPGEAIEDAINRLYERKDENALSEAKEGEEIEELQDLIDMTDEAPVIRWVNNLFYNAARDRASDIHIEPGDREVVVRYRIDGDLYKSKTAHKGFLPSIVARVKIEAGLNIAEKRLPQDGRITKKIQGRVMDVRVSTIPTAKGERIVMRLLDKEKVLLDLPDLGFDPDLLSLMEHLITRPNGIILVTGPTGAGKTTTLYACLNKVNRPDLNILTVEDPVEYELPGIGQMQIQPKIGLTFASGLRAFLRQDPDVIMVGEIRDQETADIAINASLTGHLVLSTLHTNDAAGAITRLFDMGVQPFLISSSLLAVLAQRLVRRLCPACRQPYAPSDADIQSLGLDRATLLKQFEANAKAPILSTPPKAAPTTDDDGDVENEPTQVTALSSITIGAKGPSEPVFYRPVGCSACAGTGYRGRLGIYELLLIEEPIRRAILANSDSNNITKVAVQRGMRTLRDDGARQVLLGRTSVEDVIAATQAEDVE